MELKRLLLLSAVLSGVAFSQSAGVTNVVTSFSTTPTFTANGGVTNFDITLTNNVSSSTFTSPGSSATEGTFRICQDATGGRSFVWPAGSTGFSTAIDATASHCSTQGYKFDGTTLRAFGAMGSENSPTNAVGGYATVDANGTGVAQRTTVNYISGTNATVACVDNSGANRTDCTVSATSGSSAPVFPSNAQTATYQLLASDFTNFKTILVASGTFTITGVASGSQPAGGTGVWIINYGSGVVTFARSGQNINGSATNLTIPAGSASAPNGLLVISDGTNYFAQVLGVSSSLGFASVTPGTNTGALLVGTGGSLGVSGSGTIGATSWGGTTPGNASANNQVCVGTSSSACTWETVPAAALPAALSSSTSVNGTSIPSGVVLGQTIASSTAAMGSGVAITSGTCATVVTVSATGVSTADSIVYTPSTDPTGVTGYGPSASGSLYIWAYPTSGNVNFKVCNNTAGTITPSALTLNWRVAR